ncbi:helix-turn-helix domain-containing protein [Afipia sp. P52-10]|uniref:helix-turn-helix domain-containing protein n=1 Tax=Afipia sp. P52-10 TaxID=1429916 RepID=UPI0009DCD469
MKSKGWHRADIVAAIHKRGTNLSRLARDNKLHDTTLRSALGYPRTPSNRIIAKFLERDLHELWPQWFDRSGCLIVRKRSQGNRQASSQKLKPKMTRGRG